MEKLLLFLAVAFIIQGCGIAQMQQRKEAMAGFLRATENCLNKKDAGAIKTWVKLSECKQDALVLIQKDPNFDVFNLALAKEKLLHENLDKKAVTNAFAEQKRAEILSEMTDIINNREMISDQQSTNAAVRVGVANQIYWNQVNTWARGPYGYR